MEHEATATYRQHYIDWLRIIAVLLLIPFHTARIFDIWEPNYVKNDTLSPLLSYLSAFLWSWHMPLLFLLAGAATWYSLGLRNGWGYLQERVKRLLIPFIFGVLVVTPPQAYLARFQDAGYSEHYLHFLPDYFMIRGDLTGYTGLFTPAHLWFVLYLFLFSIMGLPVILLFERKEQYIDRVAEMFARKGMIFLLALPLGIAGALPAISGKNPFYYFVLFLYGYLLIRDKRLNGVLEQNRRLALILGAVTMAASMVLWILRLPFPLKSTQDILFYSLRTFNTWFCLLTILGYGQYWLNCTNRLKRYANEAAYPFYILHQTVIVAIGFYVVRWELHVGTKFFVIALSSFMVTLLLYHVCVKRTTLTRFLFGMKPESVKRLI